LSIYSAFEFSDSSTVETAYYDTVESADGASFAATIGRTIG
jgi:hypothetical protein